LPCCAFAACIVAQIFVALGAARRFLFGMEDSAHRNPAVEWRLEPAPVCPDRLSLRTPRALGGWSYRGLAVAAALEVVIVLGALYGFFEHAGHRSEHAARVDEAEADHRESGHQGAAIDPEASPSRSNVHPSHG
jgi:hypothetical protein